METYRVDFVASTGHCSASYVRVLAQLSLVVATYWDEATSVTNECECIASAALKRHRLNPDRLLFIQHYPAQLWAYYGEPVNLIPFDQQQDPFINPTWTGLDTQTTIEVLALLASQHQ